MSSQTDITKAIDLHQRGKYDRAEKIYKRILKANPDSVDALHFLGMLEHQRGKRVRAVELIQRALDLDPGYADAHNNLGNVLRDSGYPELAEASYRSALKINPELPEALSNVAVVERGRGNLEEAGALLRRAIDLRPGAAFAHFNLGTVLAGQKAYDDSLMHLRRAVELEPELAEAYLMMARVMSGAGRSQEALAIYDELLKLDPADEVIGHMRAALSGQDAPERASDGYIELTFDRFAATFEIQLERLEYRAPELICDVVGSHLERLGQLDVLDLGCGTGWCGREIKPWAKFLTGVDLSDGMLQLARRTGVYDRVHRSELTAFLEGAGKSWDLLTIADTLCYFGVLGRVFAAARAVLKEDGLLVFTVEATPDTSMPDTAVQDAPAPAYTLQAHGRYCHSEAYVRQALADSGLQVREIRAEVLRLELGQPVDGLVVAASIA